MSEIIISTKGIWSEDSFLPPQAISFNYGGPYAFIFPYDKISLKENEIGSKIYYRIINSIQNNNNKYLFSIPSKAKLIKGKLFDDYGELNNQYISKKMFLLNKDFFENNCEIVTVEFFGKNEIIYGELYYEELDGEIIEVQDNRQYKTYELNFEKNNIVYYLGLYGKSVDLTCAYLDDKENEIIIYYKDKLNLYPVLPNEKSLIIRSNFFCLNTLV